MTDAPLVALLYAGDEVVQVIDMGGAVADEWSRERLEGWATAMVETMPIEDDITRVVVFHINDSITDVDRT